MYNIYRRALRKYRDQRSGAFYRHLLEAVIRWLVLLLQRVQGVAFPQRATGGWWWTWRWRFEVLARWHEKECLAVFRRIVRPGMTVLDVGAHAGYYTRLLSELVGPSGRVLAFEPEQENYGVLQRNLSRSRYGNVRLFNVAVSDREGWGCLYISPGSSNHSLQRGYTECQRVDRIETVTLDAFLSRRGIQTADVIKIDIEGAEPLALAGMADTIRHSPQLSMLIEYNPAALRCGNYTPADFLKQLRGLGFDIRTIGEAGRLEPAPDGSSEELLNLFCQKT